MCETKVIFPEIEAWMGRTGQTYQSMGDAHGMGGQAFRRRMSGEVEFDLAEIVWLMRYTGLTFEDLFMRN